MTWARSAVAGHVVSRRWDAGRLTPSAVREVLEQQSDFLRLTAHELRGPVTTMNNWLSMLQDGTFGSPPDPAHVDRALTAMTGSVRRMRALLTRLADAARQDAAATLLRRQRCQLLTLVAAAVSTVDLDCARRDVSIEQEGDPVQADVDPELLEAVLTNLLSNAVRYARTGVVIAVDHLAVEGTAVITVSDDGPGIPDAEVEDIFEPWYRGAASDGLGLGLWIVRRIVDWHGGRVALATDSGVGATFRIVLPATDGGESVITGMAAR